MPRPLWILIIGMTLNVTASSFLWPLNTIYLHDQLGKSLSVAGLVLLFNALASVVGNLCGGGFFDKLGGYKTVLIGVLITLVSAIGISINHEFISYTIFLTISGFGTGMVFPAIFAMAGSVWKEGGRRSFNAIYVGQNLGVAIGSALGGVIASYSFDYVFIANTFMYVLFFLVVIFGFRGIQSDAVMQTSVIEEQKTKTPYKQLYPLLVLCIGYFLCWVGYVQWLSTISAYTQEIGISLKQYSLLWTINGAMIVLAQPLLALAIKWFVKTLKAQLIFGMLTFVLSFAVAAKSTGFEGFLTAMVILTIGEMFVWPAVPAVAAGLAIKGKEGFYQGIVNSTGTAGRMIGPMLGGFLVDTKGINTMFSVLSVFILLAIVTVFLYEMMAKKALQQNKISI
jgi:MFS family permease